MAIQKKLFFFIFLLGIIVTQGLVGKVFAQDLPVEPVCNSTIPAQAPDIYKVDTTRTSATIFFIAPKDSVTGYTVAYGLTEDAGGYIAHFVQAPQNGSVLLTVNNLLLDAHYYFTVRSENGCAHGPWSTIRQSNYPNSTGPRLPTTAGETNYIFWIGLAGIACCFMGGIVLLYSREV